MSFDPVLDGPVLLLDADTELDTDAARALLEAVRDRQAALVARWYAASERRAFIRSGPAGGPDDSIELSSYRPGGRRRCPTF